MGKKFRAPFVVVMTIGTGTTGCCFGGQGSGGGVNPPYLIVTCPNEAPPAGEACLGDLHCNYGPHPPCDPEWTSHQCVDGRIRVNSPPGCNPPPPQLIPQPIQEAQQAAEQNEAVPTGGTPTP